MVEKKKKRVGRQGKTKTKLVFEKQNYQLFALSLVVLVIGYVFLSIGPWYSFWSRTLAPILLLISYCVIIPIAILY
ncbi:MAG TPA: DUF3098 domain-containing protein, partial [Bacteroidetes bacterium]|nr:DUF3098 domain-containing protein [Bacteroidota bacterium]